MVYLVHDTPPTVVDIVILLVDLGHAVETDAGMNQKNKIVQYPDGARETQIIHNRNTLRLSGMLQRKRFA